jgi:hypothetical protein
MMNLEEFTQLKRRVEKRRSEAEQAEGIVKHLKERLKKDFDCGTKQQAKKLLGELEQERDDFEEKFNEEHIQFQEKWGEKLNED